MTTVLRWGGATDVGQARTINQDSMLLRPDIFVVADGMGGHRGGEVASKLAVDAIAEHFTEPTVDNLVAAVHEANNSVWDHAQGDPALAGMGTTVVAAALVTEDDEERVVIANVGDSRAYLLQGGDLIQITDDHSLVAELVRDGRISPADAAVHPQRNIVTRALGIEGQLQVDEFHLLPFAGDRYLLCSDGLFNEVDEVDIAAVLRGIDDPDEAAADLIQRANTGGGRDNITVIIVDVVDDGGRAAAASEEVSSLLYSRTPDSDVEQPETGPTMAVPAAAVEDESSAAVEAPAESDDAAEPEGRRRRRRPRAITPGSIAFVVVLVAVVGGALYLVNDWASNTYEIKADAEGNVVVYKGRDFLWAEQELVRTTDLAVADLVERDQDAVNAGIEQGSLDDVEARLANLESAAAAAGTTSTTSTTTTTTRPRTTTTRPAGGTSGTTSTTG